MAVRSQARLGRLVLIDSLGVKFGGREERDIADIYALPADEVLRRTFADPARHVPDYARLDDARGCWRSRATARRPRSTAGSPTCTTRRCVHWLHRITRPALVLWGEKDGIVAPVLRRAVSPPRCRTPASRRSQAAAHYPQIEQPDTVAAAIERFASIN